MNVSVKKAGLEEFDTLMEWRMRVLQEVFPCMRVKTALPSLETMRNTIKSI